MPHVSISPIRPARRRARSLPVLAVALAIACVAPAARAAQTERLDLTPAEWREDLRAYATQLPKRHAKPFHFMSREAFDAEVARLDSAIDGLDADAIVARMMRLASMIGDGHTRVHFPKAWQDQTYPFGVRRFGDQFRVIRATGEADSVLGMRLVAIGDLPITEVAARIDALMAQDEHPILRDVQGAGLMTVGGVLRGIGAVQNVQQTRFTFEDDQGGRRTLVLALTPTSALAGNTWRFTSKELPIYRTKRAETLLFTWLPESKTVYCNWRSYEDLGSKAKALFAFVDAHPTERLVIDMRQNGGGDYFKGLRHMVEPVLKRPNLNREGHLFVLISPITFSAALANAIHFRDRTEAMLVGEPIGEKPNSWSENDEFTLPNSRITASYSTKYYEFAPGETMIKPDREIAPTWEEFRDGKDPVLDWIVTCCR